MSIHNVYSVFFGKRKKELFFQKKKRFSMYTVFFYSYT